MDKHLPSVVNIIGESLKNLKSFIEILAASDEKILFVGDRGTGKELFAKLYSENSKKEKLVPINCAAANDQFLYSELFGHIQGAYTGAQKDRKGLLKENYADSIFFFDEIGDSSPFFQASLLRVIEYGDYKPLGSDNVEKINPDSLVIVAATSKVTNIRPDLQDRFQRILIPKLLDRENDIIALLKHFCAPDFTDITHNALTKIKKIDWGGNVRQLKQTIDLSKHLCKLNKDKVIREHYIIPNQDFQGYGYGEKDNSDIRKISEVFSESDPLNINKFLEPKREKSRNQPSPINSELNNISESLDNVSLAISELKDTSRKVGIHDFFKEIRPDEYADAFWRYHENEGHNPNYMNETFEYPISTASRHLRNVKKVDSTPVCPH